MEVGFREGAGEESGELCLDIGGSDGFREGGMVMDRWVGSFWHHFGVFDILDLFGKVGKVCVWERLLYSTFPNRKVRVSRFSSFIAPAKCTPVGFCKYITPLLFKSSETLRLVTMAHLRCLRTVLSPAARVTSSLLHSRTCLQPIQLESRRYHPSNHRSHQGPQANDPSTKPDPSFSSPQLQHDPSFPGFPTKVPPSPSSPTRPHPLSHPLRPQHHQYRPAARYATRSIRVTGYVSGGLGFWRG